MRLLGLHHVTVICADLQRTTAFYRDLLGLALVRETVNDDDPDARHFWFGDGHGTAGTLLSFMEYPQMEPGQGRRGLRAPRGPGGRQRRRARRVARLPALALGGLHRRVRPRRPAARSTCATPTGTSSRSPRPRADRPRRRGAPASPLPWCSCQATRRRPASDSPRAPARSVMHRSSQHLRERMTLTIGHRADGLVLRHRDALEELAAARVAPTALTREQVGDRHALRLPRRAAGSRQPR